jgi:secernin
VASVCDTMVTVGPDGVLFAKNSDRDPNEAQLLDWQPARAHAAGARVRCTWIEIPQVAETHAVLLSRPFWMFGAEMGANEHGVVIGNEAVFTRSPRQDVALTGMDLLRLALERADTADRALSVIVELLERHGQGGGCGLEHPDFSYDSSFIVADASVAFVLETAGREHAVERVASGARSISNGLTIADFAAGREQRVVTHFSRSRTRRAITESGTRSATTAADLMRVLRDHGGLSPAYSPLTGAMGAPCMHAGGTIRSSQTTASWVSELSPAGQRHWVTATAGPCTSIFKPVRVGEPVDLGPAPTDRFDARTLWWRHELLHRRCDADLRGLLPLFAAERDEVEARSIVDPPEPAAAFDEADRLLESWTDAVWRPDVTERRPPSTRRYWDRRNRAAGFPSRPLRPAERAS